MCRSVRQIPHAATRTSTSPGPGAPVSISAARSGRPGPSSSIARTGFSSSFAPAINPARRRRRLSSVKPPAARRREDGRKSDYLRMEDDMTALAEPLAVLYSEHRSIEAVLAALEALVRERLDRRANVDPRVFRAALYYLDVF